MVTDRQERTMDEEEEEDEEDEEEEYDEEEGGTGPGANDDNPATAIVMS